MNDGSAPEKTASPAAAPVEVRYAVKMTPALIWAIAGPYITGRLMEQIIGLAPISVFLFIFQIAVLRQGVAQSGAITVGLVCVILGLMFFIEGLRLGVMPLGENIGATLPAKAGMGIILGVAFLLGTVATFAEPAVATLSVLGGSVKYEQAPMLYDILNNKATIILFLAAAGVGMGAMNGIIRFVKKWSLKFTIMPGLVICVVLTLLAAFNTQARDMIGVAWDAEASPPAP